MRVRKRPQLTARWSAKREYDYGSKFGVGDILYQDDIDKKNCRVLDRMLTEWWYQNTPSGRASARAAGRSEFWNMMDELDARGYDVTTLRISIEWKQSEVDRRKQAAHDGGPQSHG